MRAEALAADPLVGNACVGVTGAELTVGMAVGMVVGMVEGMAEEMAEGMAEETAAGTAVGTAVGNEAREETYRKGEVKVVDGVEYGVAETGGEVADEQAGRGRGRQCMMGAA